MDIYIDIHKDGLFSIKRDTCMFLPSVATGISLHCLNDNNEKIARQILLLLFVLEAGKQSRSFDVGSNYVCYWKLLYVLESMDEKCVLLLVSLSIVAITRDVKHRLSLFFSGVLDQKWWSVIIFSHHHEKRVL